jgi:hypothetical protein
MGLNTFSTALSGLDSSTMGTECRRKQSFQPEYRWIQGIRYLV